MRRITALTYAATMRSNGVSATSARSSSPRTVSSCSATSASCRSATSTRASLQRTVAGVRGLCSSLSPRSRTANGASSRSKAPSGRSVAR